ncbi:MAG TPA: MarR family transcriptional regulator [Tepidisphaeraceae bacterium]|nr:MarR family transcriptional regulator [Tepidisphaeraceae bacterium]
MFFLRDLPKYDAIRARAARYPEVDPAALESFLTLLRVGSDVLAAWEKYLAGHHISQGRFTVLMVLNRDPITGLNPSDLAARCGVTRATMTGLLDSLERKRLIRRESDQADRRTVLVRLNDKGIDLLEGMLHDYYRRISLLMGELSEDEKRSLTAMLTKVAGSIRHVSPSESPSV